MHPSELLILLITICLCALLAHRLKLAPPVAFLFGGIALALVGIHAPEIDPEHMLLLFLPPILMEAAFFTSLREFRANLRPILMLAIGLVILTAFAVGGVLVNIVPGMNWALGLLVGAIVSPPDAAAATSALRGAPIPRRIISILEGESLVNDASGIVLYKIAVGAVVTASFSLGDASADFMWKACAGITIGVVIGYVFTIIFPLLREQSAAILSTFIPPYAAYMMAESVHASGVLAVVGCGLLVGWRAPSMITARARMPMEALWRMVVFFLNALAFLIIGLQMPALIDRLPYSPTFLVFTLGMVSAATIAVRFLFVYFNSSILPILICGRTRYEQPAWQNVFLIGWTGMRGVVTLALALALPTHLSDGSPFPHRDLIVFLSVGVILVTLVLQGVTLPFITAALTLRFDPRRMQEEWLARVNTTRRALAVLDELETRDGVHHAALERIRAHYQERLEGLGDGPNTPINLSEEATLGTPTLILAENHIWQEVLKHERNVLLDMRRDFTIDDEVMYDVLRDIDLRGASFHAEPLSEFNVAHTGTVATKRQIWQRFRRSSAAA